MKLNASSPSPSKLHMEDRKLWASPLGALSPEGSTMSFSLDSPTFVNNQSDDRILPMFSPSIFSPPSHKLLKKRDLAGTHLSDQDLLVPGSVGEFQL